MTEKTIEIGVIGIGAQISGSEAPAAPSPDGKKPTDLTFRKLTEAEVKDYLSL
jgi:hypothetical protein